MGRDSRNENTYSSRDPRRKSGTNITEVEIIELLSDGEDSDHSHGSKEKELNGSFREETVLKQFCESIRLKVIAIMNGFHVEKSNCSLRKVLASKEFEDISKEITATVYNNETDQWRKKNLPLKNIFLSDKMKENVNKYVRMKIKRRLEMLRYL